MMTRFLFLSVLVGAMPLTMAAQDDDLYFTPKKHVKDEVRVESSLQDEQPTYYCGSNRNVDEYNRRGKLKSYYQKIGTDSLGNDIIEFHAGDGVYGSNDADSVVSVYPGSESYYDDSDYTYSRRMGRFDGFYGWYDPYYYGYWSSPYWRSYYGWYDPWYAGWYGAGWYSPWYYDSFYGWGYPYYGWRGWYGPAVHYRYAGPSGTLNHANGGGRFYGSRSGFSTTDSNKGFSRRNNTQGNRGTFGQRRSTYNNNNNRVQYQNQSRPSQSFGQGSFGVSRGSFGGGAGFGGSRGGGFGGRR